MLDRDPYPVFRGSKSPAGLYARQKWMGESQSPAWIVDFHAAVEAIRTDQAGDGSWPGGPLAVVTRLFGLHLTVRRTDPMIDAALDRLLAPLPGRWDVPAGGKRHLQAPALEGLPFAADHPARLHFSAALFLASVFGRGDDPAVRRLYDHLIENCWRPEDFIDAPAIANNLLRALVVHPCYRDQSCVAAAGGILAGLQTRDGDWGPALPFYQTLNALAHTNWPEAGEMLEKAFVRLRATQNLDGSWGRCQTEWNTFLAVHALRNGGLL